MQGEDPVRAQLVEGPVGQERGRTGAGFLGGLEQEHDAARGRWLGAQPGGERQQDGQVSVVAALVGDLGRKRGIVQIQCFGNRQGVQLGAQQERGARCGPLENSQHAVAALARQQAVRGAGSQMFGHEGGGGLFLPRKFGQGVEAVAQLPRKVGLSRVHDPLPPRD